MRQNALLTRYGARATRRIFAGGPGDTNDRSGLLRDITTILANEKVNVLGVASRSDTKQQLATIDMTIEIYNLQVLGRVLGKLNHMPDVIDARRLHGS